ncbi:MAG: hypothetical protein NAG76_11755 [Candidatus Pristimantibacillus lignocellulolyticus]|uniref:Uncharacterized protein n=1 Tax=Candidatus Pristimantibacillus lignocellulolyticus TaxID=2994561 RepID=A0A9J6Z9F6_9BACL|nr:MAG: hypothetical protein NAG76_11755 [Candidatus Pristimantibacillus lignocellulolyticus]
MKQILAFIMFSTIICWMMFAPIYKHVLITRQAILQQEVDYLLEIGASGQYGYISANMIDQSKIRLAKFGLSTGRLQYTVSSTEGQLVVNDSYRVGRGNGIALSLAYPYERLTAIDALIGIEPVPEGQLMRVYGVRMSEYVE